MTSHLLGRRVLVADDERAVAAAVVRHLEREGAVCRVAYSGSEALAQLGEVPFDLLLTDVQMPGRSGLELLEDARGLPDAPAVILMAADGEGLGAADALSRGADGYLRKPLDPDVVVSQLTLAMELRSLRIHAMGPKIDAAAGSSAHAPCTSPSR